MAINKTDYDELFKEHENLKRCFDLISDIVLGADYSIVSPMNQIQGDINRTIEIIKKLKIKKIDVKVIQNLLEKM